MIEKAKMATPVVIYHLKDSAYFLDQKLCLLKSEGNLSP